MSYDSERGGITWKSDAGTLLYDYPGKPYAVSGIDTAGVGLVFPEYAQEIGYTSFESVSTISENDYLATFTYNSDNQRAKMVVEQNGNTVLTRWYPGSSYIKETSGGVTKEYTFIGGDAYSAPVVAKKTNGGEAVYYYLLRDYLGSITHVVDATNNSVAEEYSYDSWGRMRNPVTWENYPPGSEPALFIAGRGYTGHEHLPWFSLINMNGRVYDPLTGQFLSPDNYVQTPDFTQNFNRYGYCINNPLKYTDPSGEVFGVDDVIIILAMAYFGGVQANFFYAAETGGNPFNPGDWNWSSPSTYIGIGSGALTGVGMAGYQIPTLFPNLDGILTRGVYQAGVNTGLNGIANTINGDPFFDNWEGATISGFINGAITGYQLADANGTNYWWGTEKANWGYNRNQWSIAWWDKPDKIVFEKVKNRGAGQINCMAKSFQDMYGNTEAYWDTYTNSGDEFYTMQNIRNGGGHVMKYPGNDEHVTYNDILNLDQSGGRSMITVDNYRNSGQGHAMAVKKILYVPGKRFHAVVFYPYDGSRFIIRNFNQGTTLGQNLRFWFIIL